MQDSHPNVILHIFLGIACLLGAVVIGYSFLFVDEPTQVVVLTDSASDIGEMESVLVDINTATEEEFEALQGIGPVLAKRIVEYRQANGGFDRLEDLKQVAGIGDKTFEKFRSQITLGNPP